MNYGSPLSKDYRLKKVAEEKPPKKDKPKISLATTKKVLKGVNYPIGITEMFWLNNYIQNRVMGECLPKSFLSNDLLNELQRTYGNNNFQKQIIEAFCKEHSTSVSN
jgi:hypothetical protein